MAFVELSCCFHSKGIALLFGGVIEEGHLVLDQFDGGVDLVDVVGWQKLQFLELVDDLNSVGKVFVLWLLLFLLLLWLLLGGLLIEVALLGGDDSGTAFDLLLPFFSEDYRALRSLLLFLELEGVGFQALAVGYQIFAQIQFLVVGIAIDVGLSFLLKSQLALFLASLPLFLGLSSLLLSLLVLFFLFLLALLVFLFLLLSALFIFSAFFCFFDLYLYPLDIIQQILLVFPVVDISVVLVNVIIDFIFKGVPSSLHSLDSFFIFFLDIFNRSLFCHSSLFILFLLLELVEFGPDGLGFIDLHIEFMLYRFELLVKDVDLVFQLTDLRLNLNAGSRFLERSFQFVDFVVETGLLPLADIASSEVVLFLLDPVVQLLQRIAFCGVWLAQLVEPSLQLVDLPLHSLFGGIQILDFFAQLGHSVELFAHRSGVLSYCHLSCLLALHYVANYSPLFLNQGPPLFLQRVALRLQLLQSFLEFLLVRFLQQFLGSFGKGSVFCDFVFVPIELRPGIAGWSFFFGSVVSGWAFVFVELLLFLGFLLDLLPVLRLLFERLAWVYKSFLNVLLGYVFLHRFIISRGCTAAEIIPDTI